MANAPISSPVCKPYENNNADVGTSVPCTMDTGEHCEAFIIEGAPKFEFIEQGLRELEQIRNARAERECLDPNSGSEFISALSAFEVPLGHALSASHFAEGTPQSGANERSLSIALEKLVEAERALAEIARHPLCTPHFRERLEAELACARLQIESSAAHQRINLQDLESQQLCR